MVLRSVFLSSTARDLSEYRDAVYRVIARLSGFRCVRMEDFGARDANAETLCRDAVIECDLFVGIVGHLYGSTPEHGTTSYTVLEYDAATRARIPRLMFVAPDDFPLPASMWEPDEKRVQQAQFRTRVQRERVVAGFASPPELATEAAIAIRNWEQALANASTRAGNSASAMENLIRGGEAKAVVEELNPELTALMTFAPPDSSQSIVERAHGAELVLAEQSGVMEWQPSLSEGRAAVAKFTFDKLTSDQVPEFLDRLDSTLRPARGLLEWDGSRLRPRDQPIQSGKVLLFVHGTFGSGGQMFEDLTSTAAGIDFLNQACESYDRVCAFDYSSLSDTPALNALDLHRLFRGSGARIDVISHGGGGLVTRWWFEHLATNNSDFKAVLVGCPLTGTSLATRSVRSCLGWLVNVGQAMSIPTEAGKNTAATKNLLTVTGALMRAAVSQSSLDHLVSVLVPGLASQSCSSANSEMSRLQRTAGGALPQYYAVRSSFDPRVSGWQFWQHFRIGRDEVETVFEGPNDLVVDTDSMVRLSDRLTIPRDRVFDFGVNNHVHHFNYFRQPQTLHFIAYCLHIGRPVPTRKAPRRGTGPRPSSSRRSNASRKK